MHLIRDENFEAIRYILLQFGNEANKLQEIVSLAAAEGNENVVEFIRALIAQLVLNDFLSSSYHSSYFIPNKLGKIRLLQLYSCIY